MVGSESESLRAEIAQIRRRASQQATAHSWLRDHYEFWHSTFTTLSLTLGVILVATVMASPQLVSQTTGLSPFQWQWITAALAAGSFSIVVLLLAWRLDILAERHNTAVRHYARIVYRASRMTRQGAEATSEQLNRLTADYLDDVDLPRIPEKQFLKLKRWHLIKVAVSRALDSNPHESIAHAMDRMEVEAERPEDSR